MELDLQKITNVVRNYGNTNAITGMNQNGVFITAEKLTRYDEFAELVAPDGKFVVRGYDEVKDFNNEVIMAFCVRFGIYCFPTRELIDFLAERISGRKVIEVASGHGILCKELGIKGTDNFEQRGSRAELYEVMAQTPVQYGKHVEFYDAIDAIRRYKPDVVLASWLTHQHDIRQHHRGGNVTGPKEEKILERVKEYIFIGNDKVHEPKPILDLPHETLKFPWLLSRTIDQSNNSIYVWKGEKR